MAFLPALFFLLLPLSDPFETVFSVSVCPAECVRDGKLLVS